MSKTNQQASKKSALIIVDVQNGVIGKDNETYQSEKLLSNLEYLIEKGRKANVPIIYVQHNQDGQLEHGTNDWQIHDTLAPKSGDIRIQKHHPSSFHDTDLEENWS